MTALKLFPIWGVMGLFLVKNSVAFMMTNVHNLSLVMKSLTFSGFPDSDLLALTRRFPVRSDSRPTNLDPSGSVWFSSEGHYSLDLTFSPYPWDRRPSPTTPQKASGAQLVSF